MSAGDLLIVSVLVLVVAKIYYAVGRIVGKGEIRAAHDLYQRAAILGDREKRAAMLDRANNLVFPDQPFIEAFKRGTGK